MVFSRRIFIHKSNHNSVERPNNFRAAISSITKNKHFLKSLKSDSKTGFSASFFPKESLGNESFTWQGRTYTKSGIEIFGQLYQIQCK